jgi:sulfur relay protein TusB/DsrH
MQAGFPVLEQPMPTSTLYSLASQPSSREELSDILALMDLANGSLLLRQDACYLLADQRLVNCLLQQTELTSKNLYVLEDDAIARGIRDSCIQAGATLIDYHGWVKLTLRHELVQVSG